MSQGKRHTDEHLREIARVYVAVHKSRTPVQQAVAEHFGVPTPTMAKQIMKARSRGFLLSDGELDLLREYEETKEKLRKLELRVAPLLLTRHNEV